MFFKVSEMKKIVFAIIAASLFAVVIAAAGCSKSTDYLNYVSQMRSACFFGESKSYRVTAYSEKREYPLKADGLVGETGKFVILKITFKDSEKMLLNDVYADFSLEKEYKTSLGYNAETESYVVIVAVENLPENDFTVTVTADGNSENVPLTTFKNDAVSPEKALKSAVTLKREFIDKLEASNADYEIMVRLIVEGEEVFYYVGIVESEYTTALLLDSRGALLAEKKLKNQ